MTLWAMSKHYYRHHHTNFRYRNEVKCVMYFCQLNCIFMSALMLSRCTAKILNPSNNATGVAVVPHEILCPALATTSPHEWLDETIYMHPVPNVKHDGAQLPTCQFRVNHYMEHYDYDSVILHSIHLKESLSELSSSMGCKGRLKVNLDVRDVMICTTRVSLRSTRKHLDPSSLSPDDEIIVHNQNIRFGKDRFQIELSHAIENAAFLQIVFKAYTRNTRDSKCYLQVQQYHIINNSDCDIIYQRKRQSSPLCGVYNCRDDKLMLEELSSESIMDPFEEMMRSTGYFLKGLILPVLMISMGSFGFILWRRRLKHVSLSISTGVFIPQATQTMRQAAQSYEDDDGNWMLLHTPEDEDPPDFLQIDCGEPKVYPEDPPPPYEDTIVNPPTYDEAMT